MLRDGLDSARRLSLIVTKDQALVPRLEDLPETVYKVDNGEQGFALATVIRAGDSEEQKRRGSSRKMVQSPVTLLSKWSPLLLTLML